MVHAEKRRGRSRTRVLYCFRTPPGVKVGRSALDQDAITRIEAANPDVEFDWPKILKGGGAPPPEPRVPIEARRPGRPKRGQTPLEPAPEPPPNRGLTPFASAEAVKTAAAPENWGQTPLDQQPEAPEDGGLTPELPAEGTPAHEKLGQEGVLRLRQRYADVKARVLERAEPARRDELLAATERLNPDAWTSAEEVANGLEQYESVLASLRAVVGRKRRGRKRGGGRKPDANGGAAAAATPGEAAQHDASADADGSFEPAGEADADDEGDEDPDDSGSGGGPV